MLSLTIPMLVMWYMQQFKLNMKHQCQVEPRQIFVSMSGVFHLIWATFHAASYLRDMSSSMLGALLDKSL